MNRDQARKLIERYNKGLANAEEKAWIENWYLDESRKQEFRDEGSNFLYLKDEIWSNTLERSGLAIKPTSKRLTMWPRIAAAAVIFIALGTALYFYTGGGRQQPNNSTVAADVAPGGNKAILTLANGRKVVLNDIAKGEISKQSGISVSKSNEGELIYTVLDDEDESAESTINTIATPKGGQYTVILSDGTRVMLNSASSLSFPSSFKSKDRRVELNGEAYFEVTGNKLRPFRVVSGMQTVEVLGTHFNVNAYADEQTIRTTLLEGAVKVFTPKGSSLIEPGEQVVANRLTRNATVKRDVNTAKEISWINGVFSFDGDDLKSVMRQIARWYDVDIVYAGPLNDEKYFGEISRNSRLSEVFKILELNNVQFEVNGKIVKVSYNQRPSSVINPK